MRIRDIPFPIAGGSYSSDGATLWRDGEPASGETLVSDDPSLPPAPDVESVAGDGDVIAAEESSAGGTEFHVAFGDDTPPPPTAHPSSAAARGRRRGAK